MVYPMSRAIRWEASYAYGMGIYVNWLLPIYYMFTVREGGIENNAVVITRRMIDEFRCVDGWIGIARYVRPITTKGHRSRIRSNAHAHYRVAKPTLVDAIQPESNRLR